MFVCTVESYAKLGVSAFVAGMIVMAILFAVFGGSSFKRRP